MPPEKADHQRALPKQVGGIHLDMILIEQAEFRSAVSDSQRFIRKPRIFELGGSAMQVSMTSCVALYGGAPDSNAFLNSSKRD